MNCGIYKITNTTNDKVYIGSSVQIKERFKEHLKHLKSGRHHSIHLQNAWNKYGKDSFVFEVLLCCDEENLAFYEQRAMDEYKSLDKKNGYNIRPAERNSLTGTNFKEMCQKISKTRIKKKIAKGKNHPMAKPVIINGKYYNTIKEAALDLNINENRFRGRLARGNVGKKLTNKKRNFREQSGKNSPQAVAIAINGKQYNTKKEAALDLELKYTTFISRLIRGTNINKEISNNIGRKHSLNKAVIADNKYYYTMTEAAKNLKIHPTTIRYRIKTNKQGYSWAQEKING